MDPNLKRYLIMFCVVSRMLLGKYLMFFGDDNKTKDEDKNKDDTKTKEKKD